MSFRRVQWVVFLVFVLVFPINAKAQTTVNDILRMYDTGNETSREYIRGVFQGEADGMGWMNVYLKQERKENPAFCRPPKIVLVGAQLLDILRRQVAKTPDFGGMPYGLGLFASLRIAFPCN